MLTEFSIIYNNKNFKFCNTYLQMLVSKQLHLAEGLAFFDVFVRTCLSHLVHKVDILLGPNRCGIIAGGD